MTTDEEDPWANVPHAADVASQPTNPLLGIGQPAPGGRVPPKRKASAFASFPNSPTVSQSGLSTNEEDDDEEEPEEDAEWGSSAGALGRGQRTESTSSRWASAVRRRWTKVKKFAKGVNEL